MSARKSVVVARLEVMFFFWKRDTAGEEGKFNKRQRRGSIRGGKVKGKSVSNLKET